MKKLYNTYTTPPGGWQWVIPETQMPIPPEPAPHFEALVQAVGEHYAANGFNYGRMLAEHVENGMCEKLLALGVRNFCAPEPLAPHAFIAALVEPEGTPVGNDLGRIKALLR